MRTLLQLHNSGDLYGASRSLLRLQPCLAPRWQRHVVLPEDGELAERLRQSGARVHVQAGLAVLTRTAFSTPWRRVRFLPGLLRSAREIAGLAEAIDADVLHTNTGVIASAGLAARWSRTPHAWHIRDWFQEFGALWAVYRRYIRWGADAIVAVSGPVASQFGPRARVHVIHNGFAETEFAIDRPAARRAVRDRLGLGDTFVVGCVGRIKRVRKGQEVLVDALATLVGEGRRLRCVIIGSAHADNPGEHEMLARHVAARGLQEVVLLIGEHPDVRPYYAAMDLLVLPSAQPEPFGGVVIEAMAMGIPVVATAVGGSIEQVEPGVTGVLVPPGDRDALAAAMRRVMDDPVLRASMSAAAPERVRRRFALAEKARELEEVFERVAAGR